MRVKKLKATAFILLFIYTLGACFCISSFANEKEEADTIAAISENIEISSRFFELFKGPESEKKMLAVGGGVFGLKIKEIGVSVVDSKNNNGLQAGDRILKVNGEAVESALTVEDSVKESRGAPIEFEIVRNGERMKMSTDGYISRFSQIRKGGLRADLRRSP